MKVSALCLLLALGWNFAAMAVTVSIRSHGLTKGIGSSHSINAGGPEDRVAIRTLLAVE